MPKPRAKLTPEEEAIIRKGGEPGTGAATVEPIRKPAPASPAPVETAPPTSGRTYNKTPYRPTMVRFTFEEFDKVDNALKEYNMRHGVKLSMNAWLVRAAMRQAEGDAD